MNNNLINLIRFFAGTTQRSVSSVPFSAFNTIQCTSCYWFDTSSDLIQHSCTLYLACGHEMLKCPGCFERNSSCYRIGNVLTELSTDSLQNTTLPLQFGFSLKYEN